MEAGEGYDGVPDLSDLPLRELLDGDNPVLARCVRSLLDDLGNPGESYAAHGSTPANPRDL
ncbi:FxSxx-COOH cyclophane-containing RiPP peptide [Phytohabitans sp. ZYX-F-186]|uniref:FxSxx-COOH cyclophane-containing RiPP peptide n=1 Tax=Phytohabitans maris TaxID=3071409 RepID=A0ABU0ZCB4_9ACTN|nr:FxSxx-COOH cyclophane-containing RiPP peptide [Phytohabitans sp. ZYX-F-186]MDQ7904678.1 FxSxx-COOH cyclophane-containing RiPP peptide [Phytohabitans sp. ZYX-F-186]